MSQDKDEVSQRQVLERVARRRPVRPAGAGRRHGTGAWPAGDFDYEAGGGVGYAAAPPHRPADRGARARRARRRGDGAQRRRGRGLLRAGGSLCGRGRAVGGDARAALDARRRRRSPRRCRSTTTASTRRWPRSRSTSGATRTRGLGELRRVARGPVVILTFDPAAIRRFWLGEYVPGDARGRGAPLPGARDARRRVVTGADPARLRGRLHRGLLRPARGPARPGGPALAVGVGLRRERRARARAAARRDLASGAWDARHGHLRTQPSFDGSLRLVVRDVAPQ